MQYNLIVKKPRKIWIHSQPALQAVLEAQKQV